MDRSARGVVFPRTISYTCNFGLEDFGPILAAVLYIHMFKKLGVSKPGRTMQGTGQHALPFVL